MRLRPLLPLLTHHFAFFLFFLPGADEPRPALVLSWLIAQACLFMGSLDLVSSLISELFLVVYFSLNLACFALRVSGAPNFRPHFKQFSWKTALAGALLSLAVMFISRYAYTIFVPFLYHFRQHSNNTHVLFSLAVPVRH